MPDNILDKINHGLHFKYNQMRAKIESAIFWVMLMGAIILYERYEKQHSWWFILSAVGSAWILVFFLERHHKKQRRKN